MISSIRSSIWNPNVYYRVRKITLLGPLPCQMNPIKNCCNLYYLLLIIESFWHRTLSNGRVLVLGRKLLSYSESIYRKMTVVRIKSGQVHDKWSVTLTNARHSRSVLDSVHLPISCHSAVQMLPHMS